ncbi:helix-turn-helix domain-containing protein [Arcticibacter sp.]|uniref:helix-turn-helix domain-containing protein n=1 Tax=Arcticibacter sp. TaxID=1872630 RepID=UPI00388D4837
MATEIITKEDLQIFKQELLKEIKTLVGKREESANKWLRSNQVRNLLHISPNTLQALRVSGTLKYTKVGSIFYYRKDNIDRMLEGKVEA